MEIKIAIIVTPAQAWVHFGQETVGFPLARE